MFNSPLPHAGGLWARFLCRASDAFRGPSYGTKTGLWWGTCGPEVLVLPSQFNTKTGGPHPFLPVPSGVGGRAFSFSAGVGGRAVSWCLVSSGN